jgi:hypothetical protein
VKITQKDAPWMDNNATLMEFATLYPELQARIFKKLSKFFREFISETNRIIAD